MIDSRTERVLGILLLSVAAIVTLLPLISMFSAALQPAEARLGRRVSPTVYTVEEFERRRKSRQPFLTKVLSSKHVVLLGSEHAIAAR